MFPRTAKFCYYLMAAIIICSLPDERMALAQTTSLRVFSSANIMGYLEPCG